jgi:hypothetical protein
MALAFQKYRLGQKPSQAKGQARLGPALFGLAWPGFWLQAGAGTSLPFQKVLCSDLELLTSAHIIWLHYPECDEPTNETTALSFTEIHNLNTPHQSE